MTGANLRDAQRWAARAVLLMDRGTAIVLIRVATRTGSDHLLTRLARHPDKHVRDYLARHTGSVDDATHYVTLATDPDPTVRQALASTARTVTGTALALLATDPLIAVRVAVADRTAALPTPVVTTLLTDPHPTVRARLAANSVTPDWALDRLAHDPDGLVRATVAANPHASQETRVVVALHGDDPDLGPSRLS